MDLPAVLSTYTRSKIRFSYTRYTMYATGLLLFASACTVFSVAVNKQPWFAVLGLALLFSLTVWHPTYYGISDVRRGMIKAKPFLFLLYLAYVLAIPTVVFCYLGFGRLRSIGSQIVRTSSTESTLSISDIASSASTLQLNRDYFVTTDGFVAFNLSKSVVHTVNTYALQLEDSLYFGLSNPIIDNIYGSTNETYSDLHVSEVPLFSESSPPLFVDVISQWTVAPIFQSVSSCLLSTPPVHPTCMISNVILGWAMATDTSSLCRSIGSNSCTTWGILNQSLSVFYPSAFDAATPPSVGVSAIVSSPPPDNIIKAIERRFVADGWTIDVDATSYPNGMPSLWVQIVPDIVTVASDAKSEFNTFSYIAIVFIVLTVVFMVTPFYFDVKTDKLVIQMIEKQRRIIQENEDAAIQRDQRRKQVAETTELNFTQS